MRLGRPVFLTRGNRGMLVCDPDGLWEIPGIRLRGPVDPVGAGDAAFAGISLGLAAGCAPPVAAQLGNLAAAVTVRKLKQTGTASPAEVLAMAREQRDADAVEPGGGDRASGRAGAGRRAGARRETDAR